MASAVLPGEGAAHLVGGPHSRPERKKKAHPWIAEGNGKYHPSCAGTRCRLNPARARLRRTKAQSTFACAYYGIEPAPRRSTVSETRQAFHSLKRTCGTPVQTSIVGHGLNVASLGCSETLAKSTKPEAVCKRRRSSEMVPYFLLKFHRELYSCRQTCMARFLGLLKGCESLKEKALFCSTNSASELADFLIETEVRSSER